ncbi:MAG: Na+/solute symporter [Caulobacteraceae bacterium]|nr:Na+/solute symporter [Caulobacteraceae bacterium]
MSANPATLIVFLLLFVLVIAVGFGAARWRQGDLTQLHEWGLGGRRFGTLITWFLLGGDLYTAYTFIAVPTLMFGVGAAGFFAVPYTILMYPLLFVAFPRLWSVSRRHGYVTAADFVRGRFGNRILALAIAVTGIVATIPYIALQLKGMQVVTAALGIKSDWVIPGIGLVHNMPLLVAFVALSLYTYRSGLRGTALIAVVKDFLIYATVLAAIIIIPAELGGYHKIFASIDPATLLLPRGDGSNLGAGFAYASLAFGSALALFLYPHSVTGLLSSSSRDVIQRNAIILPAYSFALALIALLGYMAIASGVRSMPEYAAGFDAFGNNFAIPALFLHAFPPWFAGVAFAANAIGALVPAAIMAIACANLFTRNIYKEFIAPNCLPHQEAEVAKIASLAVKLGALFFVLELRSSYAIELQLLGGIWICQTLPAVMISLYTRFFNPIALLIGWAAGMIAGTWMVATLNFQSSTFSLNLFGVTIPCYAAVSALVLNLILSYGFSLVFNRFSKAPRLDETIAEDYI